MQFRDGVLDTILHEVIDDFHQLDVCHLLCSRLGGTRRVLLFQKFHLMAQEVLIFLMRVSENAVEVVHLSEFFHSVSPYPFLLLNNNTNFEGCQQ